MVQSNKAEMKHKELREKFKDVLPTDNAVTVLEAVEQWLLDRDATLLEQNRELKKAIIEIYKMSKYKINHDELLYSFQDIHQFSKALLNKYK